MGRIRALPGKPKGIRWNRPHGLPRGLPNFETKNAYKPKSFLIEFSLLFLSKMLYTIFKHK
jgi:hypothetical protein